MKKKEIRVDRLRKLANHLLTGKLGHKEFSFKYINKVEIGDKWQKNGCGTLGCAAGECPIVWPRYWKIDRITKSPYLSSESNLIWDESIAIWFNLNRFMVENLFYPRDYWLRGKNFYVPSLLETATKEEVANNILLFCDKVEKGEITLES